MKQMEITFKSELEAIPNLRGMIASLISNKNQTISFINEVKTIVSEGITNAIIHGYNENNDKDIKLRIKFDDEGLYIEIEDYGIGIENISQAREVLFSTMKSKDRSGLGFTIMELFSNQFDVISEKGVGTILKIFKTSEEIIGR